MDSKVPASWLRTLPKPKYVCTLQSILPNSQGMPELMFYNQGALPFVIPLALPGSFWLRSDASLLLSQASHSCASRLMEPSCYR